MNSFVVNESADGLKAAPIGLLLSGTVVILASAGRPELLEQAIRTCNSQRGVALTGIVSVPDEKSLPIDLTGLVGWVIVVGTRGASAQRNAALNLVAQADIIGIFDDDALLRADYLCQAKSFLDDHPEVSALTGRVLLDGASTTEIPLETACAVLEESMSEPVSHRWQPSRELYGCNVVVRGPELLRERFDDRLPLYSWLEDHDLARRLMKYSVLAKVDDCVMVHRGATSGGRQSHLRFGYSQVMNPVYLWMKGSFPLWLVAREIVPRTGKNVVRAVVGSEVSWRRQRVAGNVKAWTDVLRGRITPERIVDL